MWRVVMLVAVMLGTWVLADDGTTRPTAPAGVAVSYQLPTEGPLPRTYRVTLAVTDPKNAGLGRQARSRRGWCGR